MQETKRTPKKIDKVRTMNLLFLTYAFIMNITYLIVMPAWQLFLMDFVVILLPMMINLCWMYSPMHIRLSILPIYGWGNTIVMVLVFCLIVLFLLLSFGYAFSFGYTFKNND